MKHKKQHILANSTRMILVLLAGLPALLSGGAFADEALETTAKARFEKVIEVFGSQQVKLVCADARDWKFELSLKYPQAGLAELTVNLKCPEEAQPPRFKLEWVTPPGGAHYLWSWSECRGIPPEWVGWRTSSLYSGMPLYCFKDSADMNVLTLATSESARLVHFKGGIREEGCLLDLCWAMFEGREAPISNYSVVFRFDARRRRYDEVVAETSEWMSRTAGYEPAFVPESAFEPVYSTWYNFHHELKQDEIEEELRLAAPLGMKTVIVDDGWETDDPGRDFAFVGDWQVTTNRFPDLIGHIERVHALGFKYMMWYSVPMVGIKSANFEKFKGKYLCEYLGDDNKSAVLDPRYPEVRKFIVDTYVDAVKTRNLDGLKLDFIDAFAAGSGDSAEKNDYRGCDYKSVPDAVDRLMTDVRDALTAIRPDVLIEFRQSYIGPAIRKYGNMLRAGDCPGDPQQNRRAIAHLRLTSGKTAVHADMLEWNKGEEVHSAALNVLNALFGVVQYSTVLKGSSEDHFRMIRHWLDFTRTHRTALLKGGFRAYQPEAKCPLLEGWDEKERIFGVYDPNVAVNLGLDKGTVYIVNGTLADTLVVESVAAKKVRAFDLFGEELMKYTIPAGISRVKVPAAGYLKLEK